ncbi:sugar transferase [Occultella kanbiaonis]|uniref:sugar transferase n=1 Tax=Occultella kanbiaonis TaxID=2675754 RepID=UPI0013D1B9D9|nr:sugar transferase [Occultella kanbiaonis]
MKRALDVAVAGLALVVCSPLFAVVALMVRLDSSGPAFFRQERVGLHGEPFRIHKFRTLRVGSAGPLVSPTKDPRITPVGAVLRRTKLDELPQLIDVLGGSMSVVGPRPEVPGYVALWPDAQREVILSVRPGITDPASIVLRNEADELQAAEDPERHYVEVLLPRKAAMYVEYVETMSLRRDAAIVAKTVFAVLGH